MIDVKKREEKVVKLLQSIKQFTKAEDDELRELLKDFPEVEKLVKNIEGFEKKLAKMLKDEQKMWIESINQYLKDASTQNALVGAILDMSFSDIASLSTFAVTLSAEAKKFLTKTVSELTSDIMNAIDKEVPFQVFTKRTTDWIDEWSDELAIIMDLKNKNAVKNALDETLRNGDSIQTLVLKLQEMPEFNRRRARATAITEILGACSVAQHEAYTQSPSVVGKTWRHSGTKKIKPRPHHQDLDGTTVEMDEQFKVGDEYADFPRDTNLSAKERVHCHCVLGPNIDENILGLTAEERNLIREQTLQQLGKA